MLDEVIISKPKGITIVVGEGENNEFFESTLVQLSYRGINVPVKYVEIASNNMAKDYNIEMLIKNSAGMQNTEAKNVSGILSEI